MGVLDKIAEWSLCIMIFALPFSKSLIEITIVTALVSVIIKKTVRGEKLLDKSTANILLGIFLLASMVSIVNSQYLALSIRAFFTKLLKFAALFLVTIEIIDTKKKLVRFMFFALASCVLILADGFIQYFFLHVDILRGYTAFKFVLSDPSSLGAPTASFPFPNDFAAWILMFLFPVGAYIVFGKSRLYEKSAAAAIFIALLYSLVLTRVRGAWFSFIAALGLIAVLKPKSLGILLLIIVILGTVLAYKQMLPYAIALTSVNDRGTMWNVGWSIFKEHPIIGNGVNTFFNKFKMSRQDSDRGQKGSYAHNCYLQMACDTGLLGLLSFLAFVGVVLCRGFGSLKNIKDPFLYSMALGIGLGLAAFLVHSAVDTNLYSLPLAALFWLSSGILIATLKIAEANS